MLEKFKTEYLVVVDTKDSFCGNITSFNNLLMSNSEIIISNDTLKYKEFSVDYTVQSDTINDDSQRFFHIKLTGTNVTDLSKYEELLKIIRIMISKATSLKFETLWDDVSFYYANKAYPLIHEIENLMRKLITKFMLTNVGIGWTKIHVPTVVKESIKKKGPDKKESSTDFLYETDFIQLANFLFEQYQTEQSSKLIEKIKQTNDVNQLTIDELKSFVPKSNWERYFSNIVDCELDYLKNRWEKLYDLRCKIAHNNKMNKEDYSATERLVEEIKEKLQAAIESLDKITVPVEDKETVAESMFYNSNELYGQFIVAYKKLEEDLFDCAIRVGILTDSKNRYNLSSYIKEFVKVGIFSNKELEEVLIIKNIRNRIVHDNDLYIPPEQFYHFISIIKTVSNTIKKINDKVDYNDEFNMCSSCGKREGMYPIHNEGLICEQCSTDSSKFEICSGCGTFFPWGQLTGSKCSECED